MTDTDLLIHDAQYRFDEYQGKIGWGHSTFEYAVAIARMAEVKSLAVTHHDPSRDDDAIECARPRRQASAKRDDRHSVGDDDLERQVHDQTVDRI